MKTFDYTTRSKKVSILKFVIFILSRHLWKVPTIMQEKTAFRL